MFSIYTKLLFSTHQPNANGNFGHATQWARAIRMMYGHWYPLEYELPQGSGERNGMNDQLRQETYDKRQSPYLILPNPAGNEAVFARAETELSLILEIFDLTGRMVLSQNIVQGQQTQTLDFSAIAGGFYVVRVRDEGQIIATEKFLISK